MTEYGLGGVGLDGELVLLYRIVLGSVAGGKRLGCLWIWCVLE